MVRIHLSPAASQARTRRSGFRDWCRAHSELAGDVVKLWIEKIGSLTNTMV
jgi:hypothetical protein